ncbi:7TM-DISM domain-containing protein, partial [Vibrio parahaemolyticus]
GDFQPVQGDIGLGYTSDAVWLRFRITRRPPGGPELYLQFAPNFLSTVTVYQPARPDPAGPGDYRGLSLGAPAFFDHRPYVSIERVFALD